MTKRRLTLNGLDDYLDELNARHPEFDAQLAAVIEGTKRMLDWWGERCPEYEPGCPCCEAWKIFDATKTVPETL
jgi:hypothetical protein